MNNPPVGRVFATLRAASLGLVLLTGMGMSAGPAVAQGINLVANGSFETPSVNGQSQTLNAGSNALASWAIGGNSIDVIRNFWTSKDLAQSIDLDGNAPGSIAQTLTTVPGKTYTLTFWYSSHPSLGSTPASMTVSWGPAGAPTYSTPFTFTGPSSKSNMGWVQGTATVTATSTSTVLKFTSNSGTNSNYGIALDDVRVFSRDQAPLTVAVTPSALVFGTTGTASASGGSGTGAVTFSAGTSTGCSVTGSTVSVTNASGTCAITATKAGDTNFDPITSAPVNVVADEGQPGDAQRHRTGQSHLHRSGDRDRSGRQRHGRDQLQRGQLDRLHGGRHHGQPDQFERHLRDLRDQTRRQQLQPRDEPAVLACAADAPRHAGPDPRHDDGLDHRVADRSRGRRAQPAHDGAGLHGEHVHQRRAGWRYGRWRAGQRDDRPLRLLRRLVRKRPRRLFRRDRSHVADAHRTVRVPREFRGQRFVAEGAQRSRCLGFRARLHRCTRAGALVQVQRIAGAARPGDAVRAAGRLRPRGVQGHRRRVLRATARRPTRAS